MARKGRKHQHAEMVKSSTAKAVGYILTNRTYTGMLVQGKEKRTVAATHEPLVDTDTFDAIQRSFQAKAFNLTTNSQSTFLFFEETPSFFRIEQM